MTELIIVNYYPCSFGDTLVRMLSGSPIDPGNIIQDSQDPEINTLKNPNWYSESTQNLDWAGRHQVLPAHRQNGFDFVKVWPEARVLTIIHDELTLLVKRYTILKTANLAFNMCDPTLLRIMTEQSDLTGHALQVDYRRWQKNNALDSDLLLYFSTLRSHDRMINFCEQHGLKYDPDAVDFINANI